MYFRLMAAISNLLVTPTSDSMHTYPTVLLDPENVVVVVKISLPTAI